MGRVLLLALVFFMEMMTAFMFFNHIYERKLSALKSVITGTLLFEICPIINAVFVTSMWFNLTLSFIVTLAFVLLCFKIKVKTACLYSVVLVALTSLIEIAGVFLVSEIKKEYVYDLASNPVIMTGESIIFKISYFLIAMILARFVKTESIKIRIPFGFYAFPAATLISALSFIYVGISRDLEYTGQMVLSGICLVLLFATIFVFFVFQLHSKKENKLFNLKQEQNKINADKQYFEILQKQNEDLKIYAEDTKKHLSVIKELNDSPEIDLYISKMIRQLEGYSAGGKNENFNLRR